MLFLLLLNLFSILIAESISCLGFNTTTNSCIECPHNYYRKLSLSPNNEIINISIDCAPIVSQKYTKKFYVQNLSCSSSKNKSLCQGTKENPFDNLLKTFIFIHNNETAQKYAEQEIEIFLLGSPHYLKNGDLLFDGMRFFSRFNATIKIGPLFCEEQEVGNCLAKGERNFIDLHIKTDGFSFEIYRELDFFNLRIFAYDIVLYKNSTLICFQNASSCCTEISLKAGNACKIQSKVVYLNNSKNLSQAYGFINLRYFLDYDNEMLPRVNLTNFVLAYANSVKAEEGWLSFILFFDRYALYLNNVALYNNTFPLGIFNKMNLDDDPYYKRILFSGLAIYQTSQANNIFVINMDVSFYNNYKVKYIIDEYYGLFNLKNETQDNTHIEVIDSVIGQITMDFNPKICFFFKFNSQIKNIKPTFVIRNLTFFGNIELGLVNLNFFSFQSFDLKFYNLNNSMISILSFAFCEQILIEDILVRNSNFSRSVFPFLTCINSSFTLLKGNFHTLSEIYLGSFFHSLNIEVFDFVLTSVDNILNNSQIFLIVNSNGTFKNLSLEKNSISNFLSIKKSDQRSFNNINIQNMLYQDCNFSNMIIVNGAEGNLVMEISNITAKRINSLTIENMYFIRCEEIKFFSITVTLVYFNVTKDVSIARFKNVIFNKILFDQIKVENNIILFRSSVALVKSFFYLASEDFEPNYVSCILTLSNFIINNLESKSLSLIWFEKIRLDNILISNLSIKTIECDNIVRFDAVLQDFNLNISNLILDGANKVSKNPINLILCNECLIKEIFSAEIFITDSANFRLAEFESTCYDLINLKNINIVKMTTLRSYRLIHFTTGDKIKDYNQNLIIENLLISKYRTSSSLFYFDNLLQCSFNNIRLINLEVYFAFLNFRTLFNQTKLNFTNMIFSNINLISIDIFYLLVWKFGIIDYAFLNNITVINVNNIRLFFFDGLFFKNIIVTDIYANNITTFDYFLFGVRNSDYYPSFLSIKNMTIINFNYSYVSLVSIRNFETFEMINFVFKNTLVSKVRKDYDGIFMIRVIQNLIFDQLYFTNNYLASASPLFKLISIANLNFKNSRIIDSDLVEFKSDSNLKFQVIYMDDYLEVLMDNNKIMGMSTRLNSEDIIEEYGIISIKGSSFYFLEPKTKMARFYNNFFFNNYCYKKGIIGLTEGDLIYFVNNTFFANMMNFGTITLNRFEIVVLKNIEVSFSSSIQGGTAIHIQNIVFSVLIVNAFLADLSAEEEGGGISLYNIPKMIVCNLKAINCNARHNGGAFNIINIEESYFSYTIILNSSSGYNGGAIISYESAIYFNNSYFYCGKANMSGGLVYILGDKSQFILENSLVLNFSSYFDGAVIFTSNIKNLAVFFSSILFSRTDVNGYGIINQQGFSSSNTEFGVLNLCRVVFFRNKAKFGANIFFSSNNILIIKNLDSLSNIGSLIIIESDIFQKIFLEQCNFMKNNYDIDELVEEEKSYLSEYLNVPLLRLFNAFIFINNSKHISNKGMNSYIKAVSSDVKFEELYLKNYSSIFQDENSNEKFLLDLESSNVIISNSDFIYDPSNTFSISFIFIKSCNFIISSSFLSNFQIENSNEVFLSKGSAIFITNSYFLNLKAFFTVFSIKYGNLTIHNSIFRDSENFLRMTSPKNKYLAFESLETSYSFLNISETTFRLSCDIFVSAQVLTGLLVKNSLFYPFFHESQSLYQAFFLVNIKNIEFDATLFTDFVYSQGSCIYLIEYNKKKTEEAFSFLIESSIFINNTGISGAAIYLAGSIILTVNNSLFTMNSARLQLSQQQLYYSENAGKAGCIFFDNENFEKSLLKINFTLFTKNYAEDFGPTILTKNKLEPQIENSLFNSNIDHINMTETILSFPLRLYLLSSKFKGNDETPFEYKNSKRTLQIISKYRQEFLIITSGQNFNFFILITDYFNHSLISDSECTGELSCFVKDSSIYMIERSKNQSSNGVLSFNAAKIIFYPDSFLSCKVQIKYNENMIFKSIFGSNSSYYNSMKELNFKIYVQNCTRGEVFLYDFTCFPCQRGSYSLQNPMLPNSNKNCLPCPQNAFCNGRDLITPLKGYWRASPNSTLILKCPSQESCLGIGENEYQINTINFEELSNEIKIHGACGPNCYGNLCFQCKKGYAKIKYNSECSECGILYIIYIKLTLSILFIISYVIFQTKIFSEIEKKDPHLAILTKIFLNHFQTISLINMIDLGWTIDFDIYFSIQNYLSFISEDFFIIDCFIQQIDENLLYQKTIFAVLLPILLSIIMVFVWLFIFFYLSVYRKKIDEKMSDFLINKMRMTFLIFVFFLYPEILRKSFTLLNCVSIDDSNIIQVLAKSPNIECWTFQHQLWVLTISLPGIVFWGIFAPFFILFILLKNKLQIRMSLNHTRLNLKNNVRYILPNSKRKRNVLKKTFVYLELQLADEIFHGALPEAYEIGYYIKNIKYMHSIIFSIEESEKINLIKNSKKPQQQENLSLLKKYLPDDPCNNLSKILSQTDLQKYNYFIYTEVEERSDEQEKLEQVAKNDKKLIKEKNPQIQSAGNKIIEYTPLELQTKILIRNLGFMYRGYKKEVYFWEIVIFARKFFLIFIGIYTDSFPQQIKPTILVMFLVGYLYLQIHFKPYEFKYLNYLEIFSLVTAFLTTCIGIIMLSQKMKVLAIFFVICIFLFNFWFVCYWAKFIFAYAKIRQKFGYLIKTLIGANKVKAKYNDKKKIFFS